MPLSNKYHTQQNHHYHNFERNSFSFINREDELQQFKDYFLKRRIRIIRVLGEGGTGKTSLTKKFIEYLLFHSNDTYFHSIVWTTAKDKELGVGKNRGQLFPKRFSMKKSRKKKLTYFDDLEGLYSTILKVSGHPDFQSKNPFKRKIATENVVLDWLEIRKTLIIIDDLDSIHDWGPLLRFAEIIPHPSSVIITSRKDFSNTIPGSAAIRIAPLTRKHLKDLIKSKLSNKIPLKNADLEVLINFSNGNPLLAEIASGLITLKSYQSKQFSTSTIIRQITNSNPTLEFLFLNLIEHLSYKAKDALILIVVLNNKEKDVSFNVLKNFLDFDNKSLKYLVKELELASLVNRVKNDEDPFDIHPLLIEFIMKKEKSKVAKWKEII